MANSDDRKKRIMEHLGRTTPSNQPSAPANSEQRNQQIRDHVKRTRK